MSLRLYLFGSPRIERDGHPVETDTRKAVALLAFLAVTGEYHSRESLATLLWPEMDNEHARAGLRRTLSSLRSAIGDEHLYVTRDGLALNPDHVWCDTTDFLATTSNVNAQTRGGESCSGCVPEMEIAIALYRDNFLSGFSLRDSAEFDDWQLATTEQLRRAYSAALAWLVQMHSQSGKLERALELARQWLATDPLREETHRWLMKLYAWNGAREAALRQYREVIHTLDEELGVGPLPETTALYEAIQEGRIMPPAVVYQPEVTSAHTTIGNIDVRTEPLPLIGRASAWKQLSDLYDEVQGTGRLAAVVGEMGIGKTYLMHKFLEHSARQSATIVAANCYEGETNLAYAPITAALRTLLRQPAAGDQLSTIPSHWLAEAARLAPELDAYLSDPHFLAVPDASGAQARFFNGVSEVFCRLLRGPVPGIFFLDDVHWADEASLELLAYLGRRLADLPILLVLSWADDAGRAAGGRLRRLMAEAHRGGTGRLMQLSRWRPSDVLQLVMANENLRSQATDITDRLYRETEGLPFFVVEYLSALRDVPDGWTMPQSVRDLLAGRLSDVDQTSLQIMQTAAVIGRSFDYATLLEASGRSEEEVVAGLERLLASGLIREVSGDILQLEGLGEKPIGGLQYDFTHSQLRSLVYEEIYLARRRLLHRRVAAALQLRVRGPQGEALTPLIAGHFHLGGQDDLAADYYYRAGCHARNLFANREALEHFRTALALGSPDTPPLHEAIGDLHTLLGEYQLALQAYESAAAQAANDAIGRLEHKIGHVYERRGNRDLAESHYCAALARYQTAGDEKELARLSVDRSRVAYQSNDFGTSRSLAQEALAQAERTNDIVAKAQAQNTLGILARQAGETVAARAHLADSLELAQAAGATAVRVAALNNMARLLESEGQIEAALALLEQAIALCTREGDRHREAALYNHRADLLHRAGNEEASMASLKQAVTIYAEIGMESGDWQPEIWKLTEW